MADFKNKLIRIEQDPTRCSECSVRRLSLFHGVSEEDLAWTAEYREHQSTVQARKKIYREGQLNNYMYTVYHGWLATYKMLDNGRRQILRIALPGDILGFQPNLEAPMTHSAMSVTDAVLCAFSRRDIPELLRKNLSVAKRLQELNARDMNICQSRLLTIGQHSAAEKIAFLCAELFFRIKSIYNEKEKNEIFFPLTQEDIGDAIGLTKVHVNRTLKTMREKGLLEISSSSLKVLDPQALCELGNFDPAMIQTYRLY